MIDDSNALANNKARDERKEAYLREMMDRCTARLRALDKLDASSVAHAVHITIDNVLERDLKRSESKGDIKCRKGCSHCCRGPVEIWPQEAELLVQFSQKMGMEIDEARLDRQSHYTVDDWLQQPAGDRACVFLGDDGTCKVYEVRPNACRKLLVMTDPALCDVDKHSAESVGRWFSWEAEIIEAAALQIYGPALMPRSLLAILDGRE